MATPLSSRIRSAVLISTVASLSSMAMALPQGGELSGARQLELSTLMGSDLNSLLGKEFKDYSVMAVIDGALKPIPYQFDDRNVKGFIHVPGGKLGTVGTEGVLDKEDELVFMYTDTGPQASAGMFDSVAGEVVSEMRIDDAASGAAGFAYLMKGNSERSDRHYTHFDMETGKVKTERYSLDIDPDNLLSWGDLIYNDYKGGHSIIDTMKIRIMARVGFFKATINNNLIPNHVAAVKNGPVRTIIEVDASIAILGITLGDGGACVEITNQSVQFPVYATIPKAAAILSDLNIGVSLDFHQLDGARVRSALGPEEPLIAGGGGSDPSEHNISLENDWLAGSTGKGYDIIAFFQGSPTFHPTLNMLYNDAGREGENDTPERYDGGHPQVGYYVSDIPNDQDIVVGVNLFFGANLWNGNKVTDAVDEIRNPASVMLVPVATKAIAAD